MKIRNVVLYQWSTSPLIKAFREESRSKFMQAKSMKRLVVLNNCVQKQ